MVDWFGMVGKAMMWVGRVRVGVAGNDAYIYTYTSFNLLNDTMW